MNFWNKILEELNQKKKLVLMCVLDSDGSSPGRQGFKMYVTDDHKLEGSIGGGIMEHKLIELAKSLLDKGSFQPFIKKQIHRKNIEKEQSGMICSGEQTIGFYHFDDSDLPFLEKITSNSKSKDHPFLILNHYGFSLIEDQFTPSKTNFESLSLKEWTYKEPINHKHLVHIIGGGHVGLALSQVMNQLDFHVKIYDERNNLNTMENNSYAHERHVVNYQNLTDVIPDNSTDYLVLMSFGYRTDETCIKQLLNRNYRYFGVMGSKSKMETLFTSLLTDGFEQRQLDKIHTPIGIEINSQTPMEIAISVAAQIIAVKNGKFLIN